MDHEFTKTDGDGDQIRLTFCGSRYQT